MCIQRAGIGEAVREIDRFTFVDLVEVLDDRRCNVSYCDRGAVGILSAIIVAQTRVNIESVGGRARRVVIRVLMIHAETATGNRDCLVICPITVPVESTGRDKVLKELLGEDTGPLNTEADSSPAPYELTADTFLDESAENTAADPYYELFKEFLAARKQCGLDVDHLEFGDFQDKVLKKEADFKSRHMCDSVVLEVFVKDGKVGLKARPA